MNEIYTNNIVNHIKCVSCDSIIIQNINKAATPYLWQLVRNRTTGNKMTTSSVFVKGLCMYFMRNMQKRC